MILAVDVDYHDQEAIVAGVLFHDWTDEKILREYIFFLAALFDSSPKIL